jgi:hypothetical protein
MREHDLDETVVGDRATALEIDQRRKIHCDPKVPVGDLEMMDASSSRAHNWVSVAQSDEAAALQTEVNVLGRHPGQINHHDDGLRRLVHIDRR